MCIESVKSKEARMFMSELEKAYKASLLKGFYIQSNIACTRHVVHIYMLEQHYNTEIVLKLLKHIEDKYKNSVIAVNKKSDSGPTVIDVHLDAKL